MKPNTVGFTAVLADDEELILKRLEESVNWEELNIQLVSLAQNGKQALEAILTFKPDLAVIDIRMPEISGLEVIQRSRNAGIQTDFIILSGYDDFSYAQEAIRYGARAYLLKPVNSSELYDEIYRICLEHSRRKGPRISRLYQNKLNVSFFNKLIDSKILEPGIIQQILSSTELNISDSPCYVCVIQFDDDIPKKKPPLSADELTAALDRHFAHEKHVFWNYNARQVVGIFNISSTLPFQNAMGCLEVIRSLNLSPPVIGIGDTVSSLMECPYSYNRALTAMTYQLYDDTSRIFTSESICTIPPTLKLSDIDYLPLIQFIVKKDLEGIRTYCNDFMNRLHIILGYIQLGRPEEAEEENVARLLRRLTACPCFPHEIGLFLGYPLEDVRGFMENCGRNYRLCGCWKVYGDPEAALRCFARYRKCARLYLQRYTEGHSLSRLTVAG